VDVLLHHKSDVNARCLRGSTPLHVSSAMNFLGVVCLLLECGADRTIQALDGRTAYDIAVESRHYDLFPVLENPQQGDDDLVSEICTPLKSVSLKGKEILIS
jgi:ankyrin repeat protein